MLPHRATSTSIRSLRPLRPPSIPKPRLFTQNTSLLLTSQRLTPRPHLPYLSQPAFRRPSPLNQELARLLSTENKRYIKHSVWLAAKWNVIGWVFLILGAIAYNGIMIEIYERKEPTPTEWSHRTRHALRSARAYQGEELIQTVGFVDWARVGTLMLRALTALEDPAGDGKGLQEASGDGKVLIVPGAGRAGFDISEKSWPWRSGYFEVIMGCAKAAEHLDGMVVDKTRKLAFPKAVVVGPSNPDPRPTPPHMAAAPREEDCVPPFAAPETFYVRVLTGKGFTTGQRMLAASSYANWLEFKGLKESAEEMYRWAIDIAKEAIPVNVDDLMDSKSAVLKDTPSAREVTPNLLRAVTDLAIHHARTGNVAAALPILLSVLRARRSAPVSPFPEPPTVDSKDGSDIGTMIISIFSPPEFPPPPPSGDNPIVRTTDKPTCEDSELMLYIGEILFATSPASSEGIGWTKQAVNIADANLAHPALSPGVAREVESRKCKECLLTGVGNWDTMLARLASQQDASYAQKAKGWFSWGGGDAGAMNNTEIEDDRIRLEAVKDRIAREGVAESLTTSQSNPSGVWTGY